MSSSPEADRIMAELFWRWRVRFIHVMDEVEARQEQLEALIQRLPPDLRPQRKRWWKRQR